MAKKSNNKAKDAEKWQKAASYLAIALAVTILGSGIYGSWISSQNRALEAFKTSHEHLRISNSNVTEKLTISTNKLEECKVKNEKLEEAIFKLKVENASIKALADE